MAESLPEYHFTSAQLADYLDKVRPVMVQVERERCARIAEQTETWNQTVEKTDSQDLYTGHYEMVQRTTPKWRDGKAIADAIRRPV